MVDREARLVLRDEDRAGQGRRRGNRARLVARLDALRAAESDERLQSEIEAFLAENLRMVRGMDVAARHARRAVELAERSGDATLIARALAIFALIEFNAGSGVQTTAIERPLELEATSSDWLDGPARSTHGHHVYWSGRLDAARERFEAVLEDCRRRDEFESSGSWYLSQVELRAGNWKRALKLAQHTPTTSRSSSASKDQRGSRWSR